ncbi:YlxR family protein [Corynebacterium sp. CNCTC7651]|uniref:YlxR family protein n=1 Tax=Corynebacterium sp. CNCTC7651 TaxID=2815361 RepID=UPI001F3AB719|nr:YlxR family protein [Corynebacterium sp. CNCTC7651]UIZ91462.1 YlxR family protein [Corynebacterium sp. CNCTC7651]
MGIAAATRPRKRPIRVRTCVATREQLPDTRLLRVVADPDVPGRILPDPNRCMPGRGAWVTPTLEALELAEHRRAFARALRLSTPVDVSQVRSFLASRETDAGNDPHDDRKTEH